jgi:cyclopropane fatty-acyl-phospholipid synthase-like methyltransferase
VVTIAEAVPRNATRIVEIGCGFGRLTRVVAQRYPAATVSGIDVNPHVLEEAAAIDAAKGVRNTRYVCQDHLGGFTGGVDAIYSVTVFQHLTHEEQQAYIQQAGKLLRPGGALRLQFVQGDEDAFCSHQTPAPLMVEWLHQAGLQPGIVSTGNVHKQWSWITATKQEQG